MPIYEPGLAEMVQRNTDAGRMQFTTCYSEGLKERNSSSSASARPRASTAKPTCNMCAAPRKPSPKRWTHPLVVINKSTVPVGTGDWTTEIIERNQPQPIDFAVVSCPEFLREGSAIADFMQPDRTVLGST